MERMRSGSNVLVALAALLIGGLIGWIAKPAYNQNDSPANTSTPAQQTAMQKMEQGDTQTKKGLQDLQGKTGDAFDAAFINTIVEHHMAATAMAKYVDNEAPHDEIKKLATSIISSQTKQIGELQDLAIAQGYDLVPSDPAMTSDMSAMLEGKTGADLEKQFMQDMIKHHQAALDMAKLAPDNAKNEEIKRIAAEMTSEQTKEIQQLQAWGQQWGYQL